ncbi:MAG: ester cyclase [Pseudonocardiaceae bacterium]
MTTELGADRGTHNKKIVDEFIQALFTRGELDAVDRYLDPGFVNHDPDFPGAPEGPEGMRQAAAMVRAGAPNWRSDLHQLVAEDDLVVERFTASGTHTGVLMGAPPSGRRIVLDGINIFRLDGDRIVERWGQLDTLGLLRQLGLVPG